MWASRKTALAALAAACVTAAPIGARQQQPARTFQSSTQVVEVDLRVFDREGRFVTDLRPDEIEILEDGVAQRVVTFSLVGSTSFTSSKSPTPPPSTDPTSPTPGQALTTPRQTWIFLFDLNHLTPGNGFDRARKGAADFARARFNDGDMAGVVAGNRMVNNRLSSVKADLIAAIESVRPNDETLRRNVEITRQWPRFLDTTELLEVARNRKEAIDRVAMRACSDDPGACERAGVIDMEVGRAEARQKASRLEPEIQRSTLETFSAINVLANGLARIPGPKTVVLFGDGFTITGMETSLRTLVGQVARAGARLYAVDTRGLNRRGAGIIDQARVTDEAGGAAMFDTLEDGPNSLAVDTGGLMIRNENNIGRALETIASDSDRYYVLGYEPEKTAFDGKYRAIEVRVKREGVRARARKGYLAIEPSRMLSPKPIGGDVPAPAPAAPPPMAAAAVSAAETVTAPAEIIRPRADAAEHVKTLSAGSAPSGAAEEEASRGWDAYRKGDLESALPLFEAAAARPDARPWALYAFGLTLNGLSRPRDAAAVWERVRAAAPDFPPVYMDLAATYGAMSELSNALAVLREAETRWPRDADVHNGIGVILVRRGALDQAIEAFQRAAAAEPKDAVTYLNLGRAYELRYKRELRYVSSQRRWVSREEDRQKAAESYERCIALGGAYALQAKMALTTVWK